MQVAPLLRVLAVLPTVTGLHSQTGKGTSGTLRSRAEQTDRTKPVLQVHWHFSASEGQLLLKGHQDAGCPL